MNIKPKIPFILIFMVILTSTALVASANHEINTKTITKSPTAAFSASPISGYTPMKVAFTDRSTGNPTSWCWSFGDGTQSNEKNPVHFYNKAGKYTVTLTVKNVKGKNKISKCNYISVHAPLKPPVAAFTASPTSGYSPLKVVFTDTSTRTPTSWYWNFGDGTSSNEKNPTHTYNKTGKYTVTLTVKNLKGNNKITKCNYIVVLKSATVLPVANFSSNVTKGYSPLSVQFNDSSANATSWDWDFGDGTSSTGNDPIHTYSNDGLYNITLTAKNANGNNKITKNNYITVDSTQVVDVVCNMTIYKITAEFTSEYNGTTYYFCWSGCKKEFDANPEKYINSPVANFSSNVSEGDAPLSVQFFDHSKNANEVSWDFESDGTKDSSDRNPIYEYKDPGKYLVNLTAINSNGKDSTSTTITVFGKTAVTLPVANFSSNVTKGYSPLPVQFNDSSANATSWDWDFGDGNYSTDKDPIHTYSNDGLYNLTLTAKNANGNNTSTKYGYITVDSTKVIDVVCKMNIYRITAKYSSEYNGITYYFCGPGCKKKFDANPGIYLTLPVANFSSNVTKGYSPLTVQFNDSSINTTKWAWDFGDGGNSTDKDPVHTYSKEGKYNVSLTANNGKGNDTILKSNYITVDSTTAKDLVCGMIIDKSTALTWEYKGITYYFCREECKTEFEENPEKYINP